MIVIAGIEGVVGVVVDVAVVVVVVGVVVVGINGSLCFCCWFQSNIRIKPCNHMNIL